MITYPESLRKPTHNTARAHTHTHTHIRTQEQLVFLHSFLIYLFIYHHHHHHHHHISVMELGHLLTRSGLTYPEVSSKAYHDSFCQLGSSVSLPWVIYFVAFYLHVAASFPFIPVICPKYVLFLTPLQFVHLFCNLSKCILLFFSCISSLLLLFFFLFIYFLTTARPPRDTDFIYG